jgi:outer membrane lipase/esterase
MLRTRQLAGAIAATLLFSSAAAATQFDHVIVFGDSLSDAGNISLATAPGIQPPLKFTTNPGNVGIQNVASKLGMTLNPSLAGGTDYAWGGAGVLVNSPGTPAAVPTITNQVGAYLAAGQVDHNALYSMWGGANDIFYHAAAAGVGAETSDQAQAGVAGAAVQELKLIGQLQAAGVKNILVFNLPNIGTTPEAAAQGPAGEAALAGLSQLFNGQLNAGLAQMKTGIIPINAYGLLTEVVANPTAYGFTNATTPACGAGSSSVQCGPQGSGLPYTYAPGTDQSYVFADGVHPTTAAHALLGQYVLSVLQAPSQISLLGEAPLQVSSVQTRVVRNQMSADSNGGETRSFVNIDYGRQRYDAGNGVSKTDSNDVNLTLGADMHANDNVSAGVALGIAQNNAYVAGGGGYKLQDISGLGYLTYHQGGGYIGGYADFGQSNFKNIDRRIDLGTMARTESGKADGSHLGGGFTGGWWFDMSSLRTGPFATIDWETVKVNGYTENGGDSSAMWFGRQQRDALVGTLGWRLQGHFDWGNLGMVPYAELAWNHDSKADPREITAGLNSMNGSFALTGFIPDKSWGTADIGVTAQLTPTVTSWVGYNGRFGDNSQKYNSFNMGVKILF